jgi:hypothetical protein
VEQTFQLMCLHTRTHISQLSAVFLTHNNTCAQHINTRHCLKSCFVCLQAGLQSACIRKVLRPANCISFSSVLLSPTADSQVGPKPHIAALPKTWPFPHCLHFVLTHNQPQCPPLPPAAHPNTPLSNTVTFALTNALPCYQPAFTRRTSGHCM